MVAPPVIEPIRGILVFKQVAVGPEAVICTAGSTWIELEKGMLPHSFVSVKV